MKLLHNVDLVTGMKNRLKSVMIRGVRRKQFFQLFKNFLQIENIKIY